MIISNCVSVFLESLCLLIHFRAKAFLDNQKFGKFDWKKISLLLKENRIRLRSKIVPKYLHENKFHFESQFEISIPAKRRKCINFYFSLFTSFLSFSSPTAPKTIGIYLICQWQLDFLFHKCNTGWKKIREWRKAHESLSPSFSLSLPHSFTLSLSLSLFHYPSIYLSYSYIHTSSHKKLTCPHSLEHIRKTYSSTHSQILMTYNQYTPEQISIEYTRTNTLT